MVGPVVNIGVSGSGRFASPNYAPLGAGYAALGQGLGKLFENIGEQRKKEKADKNFATLLSSLSGGPAVPGAGATVGTGPGAPDPMQVILRANELGLGDDPRLKGVMQAVGLARGKPKERRIVKGPDGRSYYEDTKELVLPGVNAPEPDPTTEQRNIAAFLKRNPGKTEADYFAQKRAPGTNLHVSTADAFKDRFGSSVEPGMYWTGKVDEAGAPIVKVIPKGSKDPSTKTGEAAIKAENAATVGQSVIDVFAKKGPAGKTVFEAFSNLGDQIFSKIPLAGNYIVSEEFQQAHQAISNLTEALLRLASGAAVPETEVDRYRVTFTPRPGDRPSVVRQKLGSLVERVNVARGNAGMELLEVPEDLFAEPGAPGGEGASRETAVQVSAPAAAAPTPAPDGMFRAGGEGGGPPESGSPGEAAASGPGRFATMSLDDLASVNAAVLSKEEFKAFMARLDQLEGGG